MEPRREWAIVRTYGRLRASSLQDRAAHADEPVSTERCCNKLERRKRYLSVERMITFEHRVPETTTGRVYPIIEEWLGSQKAKVKQSQPPAFIEASHGRSLQPMGWKKDAKKTIIFNISQEDRDVLVRVELKPASLNASDVRSRIDQARANWNELLSDLWFRLGDFQAPQQAMVNPPVSWELSRKKGIRMVYSGIVLMVLGILATIVFASTLALVFTGLIIAGVLAMTNGAMIVRSAKKRLVQLEQASP